MRVFAPRPSAPLHSSLAKSSLSGGPPGQLSGRANRIVDREPANGHAVQRKRLQGSESGGVAVPSSVHEVLRSPGQPLDSVTRAFMEPRFGFDFSHVRVHVGSAAEKSARDVNAQAYTVGRNIVFGRASFAPNTHEGRHLLAHELTAWLAEEVWRSGEVPVYRSDPG